KLLQEAYDLANSSLRHFRLDEDDGWEIPWGTQPAEDDGAYLPGFRLNGENQTPPLEPEERQYVNNTFDAIFFRNLLQLCDRLPEQVSFRQRVVQALHRRVNVLQDEYDTLLDQAGALQLAILAHQHPITWHPTIGPVVLPAELLSPASPRRGTA
ncbi:MAG TPA: hypothetical protein VFT58_05130, partial [Nitrososphaera sp.]|nr:hypothetical protein [Nitrososphaera sp.]